VGDDVATSVKAKNLLVVRKVSGNDVDVGVDDDEEEEREKEAMRGNDEGEGRKRGWRRAVEKVKEGPEPGAEQKSSSA
jgi:hypothetical protein